MEWLSPSPCLMAGSRLLSQHQAQEFGGAHIWDGWIEGQHVQARIKYGRAVYGFQGPCAIRKPSTRGNSWLCNEEENTCHVSHIAGIGSFLRLTSECGRSIEAGSGRDCGSREGDYQEPYTISSVRPFDKLPLINDLSRCCKLLDTNKMPLIFCKP